MYVNIFHLLIIIFEMLLNNIWNLWIVLELVPDQRFVSWWLIEHGVDIDSEIRKKMRMNTMLCIIQNFYI